jgi:hypothetical protein
MGRSFVRAPTSRIEFQSCAATQPDGRMPSDIGRMSSETRQSGIAAPPKLGGAPDLTATADGTLEDIAREGKQGRSRGSPRRSRGAKTLGICGEIAKS